MKKSVSIPNLGMVGQVKNIPMRKSVSTNALTMLDVPTSSIDLVEAVLVSNAPIHQAARCVLPDAIGPNFKVNNEVMTCLLTPCEAPGIKEETESNMGRSYLQLALENEDVRNKYLRWLSRVRKMRKT